MLFDAHKFEFGKAICYSKYLLALNVIVVNKIKYKLDVKLYLFKISIYSLTIPKHFFRCYSALATLFTITIHFPFLSGRGPSLVNTVNSPKRNSRNSRLLVPGPTIVEPPNSKYNNTYVPDQLKEPYTAGYQPSISSKKYSGGDQTNARGINSDLYILQNRKYTFFLSLFVIVL